MTSIFYPEIYDLCGIELVVTMMSFNSNPDTKQVIRHIYIIIVYIYIFAW